MFMIGGRPPCPEPGAPALLFAVLLVAVLLFAVLTAVKIAKAVDRMHTRVAGMTRGRAADRYVTSG
jgi:hypothetical protein